MLRIVAPSHGVAVLGGLVLETGEVGREEAFESGDARDGGDAAADGRAAPGGGLEEAEGEGSTLAVLYAALPREATAVGPVT
ncbi:hypothetical protein R1sor_025806 [Riccia sorocarpa]|uniref:Histone H3 n=1 Tax=Riccia sorocarpa TaxID=122646 RepID=A0ABD3G9N5_9MARC